MDEGSWELEEGSGHRRRATARPSTPPADSVAATTDATSIGRRGGRSQAPESSWGVGSSICIFVCSRLHRLACDRAPAASCASSSSRPRAGRRCSAHPPAPLRAHLRPHRAGGAVEEHGCNGISRRRRAGRSRRSRPQAARWRAGPAGATAGRAVARASVTRGEREFCGSWQGARSRRSAPCGSHSEGSREHPARSCAGEEWTSRVGAGGPRRRGRRANHPADHAVAWRRAERALSLLPASPQAPTRRSPP